MRGTMQATGVHVCMASQSISAIAPKQAVLACRLLWQANMAWSTLTTHLCAVSDWVRRHACLPWSSRIRLHAQQLCSRSRVLRRLSFLHLSTWASSVAGSLPPKVLARSSSPASRLPDLLLQVPSPMSGALCSIPAATPTSTGLEAHTMTPCIRWG